MAVVGGDSRQNWTPRFFAQNPKYWRSSYNIFGCTKVLTEATLMQAKRIRIQAPKDITMQQIFSRADSAIRGGVAQLRFEIGLIALGEDDPPSYCSLLPVQQGQGAWIKRCHQTIQFTFARLSTLPGVTALTAALSCQPP